MDNIQCKNILSFKVIAVNVSSFVILFLLVGFLIVNDESCGNTTNMEITTPCNYSQKTFNITHGYMNSGDNIFTNSYDIISAYQSAYVTLVQNHSYSVPSQDFDANFSQSELNQILCNYTLINWDEEYRTDNGFIVSAKNLLNPPSNLFELMGYTLNDPSNPQLKIFSYIFIDAINSGYDLQYRTMAKSHFAIHELGHMRRLGDEAHLNHTSDNYCCVMNKEFPLNENCGYTPQTLRFCEKHKCLINTNPF